MGASLAAGGASPRIARTGGSWPSATCRSSFPPPSAPWREALRDGALIAAPVAPSGGMRGHPVGFSRRAAQRAGGARRRCRRAFHRRAPSGRRAAGPRRRSRHLRRPRHPRAARARSRAARIRIRIPGGDRSDAHPRSRAERHGAGTAVRREPPARDRHGGAEAARARRGAGADGRGGPLPLGPLGDQRRSPAPDAHAAGPRGRGRGRGSWARA